MFHGEHRCSALAEQSDYAPAGARHGSDRHEGEDLYQNAFQGVGLGRPGEKRASFHEEFRAIDFPGEPPEGADSRDVVGGSGQLLDALFQNPGIADGNGSDGVAQEGGTFAARLEQRHRDIRPDDRQRETRQTGPGPDVEKSSAIRN